MPLSRPLKNAMRSAIKPVAGTKSYCGPCDIPNKQYNHTGKKYTGPNYVQKAPKGNQNGSQ